MRFINLFYFCLLLLIASPLAADQFEPFSENGKVGLKNLTTNTIVIPASFQAIGWSDKSFSIVNGVTGALQNEKWALVDIEGHKITDHYFSSLIPSIQQNFIASKRQNYSILTNYGLIDAKGKTLIEFKYGSIIAHSSGLIVSEKKDGRYQRGFISERGQEIIPVEFEEIRSLSDAHLSVSNTKNHFAIFDTQGKALTDFQYEFINPYQGQYYLIGQYNHQGLLSTDMEMIIPPLYKQLEFSKDAVKASPYPQWDLFDSGNYSSTFYFDDINFLKDAQFSTSAGGKTGIINLKNEYHSFLPEETLVQANEHILITRSNSTNRLKVYDSKGRSLFRDSFEDIVLTEQVFFAKTNQADGHSWSVYNFEGKKLNLFNYQSFTKRSDSFFEAKRNNKIGLIGTSGKETSPFLYDKLSDFTKERAIALYNGNYGIINQNGIWIMTPYYDSLSFLNEFIYFEQGSEAGLADWFGKVLYRDQQKFEVAASAIIKQQDDSTLAIYSMSGERLLEHDYNSVRALSVNLLLLQRENKHFVYSPSSGYDLKLDDDIEQLNDLKNGYASVLKGGQWGFLNSEGRLTIANRYEDVGSYSEGLFSVKLIGKWGFVNLNEEIIIQPNFDQVDSFENGMSIVSNSGKWGIINTKGEFLLTLDYEHISRLGSNFIIHSNHQIGLADANARIIKNPSFDNIKPLEDGYYLVERNGLLGVINSEGHDIIPTSYQSIKQSGHRFLASKSGEVRTFKLK